MRINPSSGRLRKPFALATKSVRCSKQSCGPAPPCAIATAKLFFAAIAIVAVTVAALAMPSRQRRCFQAFDRAKRCACRLPSSAQPMKI